MAKESQWVHVGKRDLELTNLSKVLDASSGALKAEVIQYYLSIAPTLLRHARGRPLSLVRMPDGIDGERFFQKNVPDWAPDWITSIKLGEDRDTKYVVPEEVAHVVWLANLACIELHIMQGRMPTPEKPDQIVFDLDPPPDYPWTGVVDLAVELGDRARGFGYHPFAKTSGQKGIHVVLPIEPRWDIPEVMEAAREIAETLTRSRPQEATLSWSKKAREERVLIDLNRNRSGQTVVAAYSLRGAPGLTVSMPLPWERLRVLESPREFDYTNVPAIVEAEGDAWSSMAAYAVTLHTDRPKQAAVDASALEDYEKKRRFDRTTEPGAELGETATDRFVVHRHHASSLHLDLRLEQDGVLRSWALPRGLPHRPGIRRLAVEVEPHPVKYLDFEGVIPKGEYGAGPMWVFARGRHAVTKVKKTGFYFRLSSEALSADYRMHRTEEKNWLLERVDEPQIDWIARTIAPMLCVKQERIPPGDDHFYEVKWDGIRAMITVEEGVVRIHTRNGNDVTDKFPELADAAAFSSTTAVLDGEIVCLDAKGRPEFGKVIRRLQRAGGQASEHAAKKSPVVCYLFDALYLDGRDIVRDPIERRRAWLEDQIRDGTAYRFSRSFDDGGLLFRAAEDNGLEGVIAKKKGSAYRPGQRSDAWIKVKVAHAATCLILGFTPGAGEREGRVGSLVVAETDDKSLLYRGRVGSGLSGRDLDAINDALADWPRAERPSEVPADADDGVEWLAPGLFCDASYVSLTENGTFRAATFRRLRPDLTDPPPQTEA